MPTYIKEVPSREWLNENYCIIENYICWKEKIISRGRESVRAGKRITNYPDGYGYIRVCIKGKSYPASRIIYQMVYGDLTPDFEIDHIDKDKGNNSINNLRKVPQGINKRNKSKQKNAAGENTGVCLCKKKHPVPHQDKVTEYYVARWYDIEGKLIGKNFNIDKLGREEAYRQALEYRETMIEELNSIGAGYTDSHGK